MRSFRLVIAMIFAVFAVSSTIGAGKALAEAYDDIDTLRKKGVELYSDKKYAEAAAITQDALEQSEARLGPDDAMTGILLRNLAVYLASQSKRPEAEPLLLRSIAVLEKARGPEHSDLYVALDVLGRIRLGQKRTDEALALFQRAVSVMEKDKDYGPDSAELVPTLDALAVITAGTRRLDEAQDHRKRIVAVMEKKHGAASPQLIPWLLKLARLYAGNNRTPDAETAYQRVIAIAEKAYGADALDLVELNGMLAESYTLYSQGQYARAAYLYRRNIAIVAKEQGPDNLALRQWHDALGKIYERQYLHRDAEREYHRSLELVERAKGPDDPAVFDALNNLSRVYTAFGKQKPGQAGPLYQRMLAIKTKAKGPDHPDLVPTLNKLAELYQLNKQHAEAEDALQRAFAIVEKAQPDTPELAAALHKLASFYSSYPQNDYAKAEPLYLRSLAIREKTAKSPDDSSISGPVLDLASLYRGWKRHAEAEPYFRRLLAMREKQKRDNDQSLRVPLENLGENLQAQGRFAEADAIFRRLLEIMERDYGAEHFFTAAALGKLAKLHTSQSRYADAEPFLRRIVARAEKSGSEFGGFDLHQSLNDLGKALQALNRMEEAEATFRRALATDEAKNGPNDQSVFFDLINLSAVLQDTNQLPEAERLTRRALAIVEANGPSYDVGRALNQLALLLAQTDRTAEAEKLFRRALEANEKGGFIHHVASVLGNLAGLLQDTGRLEEAEPLLRRALAIYEKEFGEDSPQAATQMNNLASLLLDARKYEEAEPLQRRALAITEKAFGADHPKVATRLNNLAMLLNKTGRMAEAEPLLRRAVAIDEKGSGPDHPSIAANLNNLAETLLRTKRLPEAEEASRRAFAVNEKNYGIDHPRTLTDLHNLGILRALRGDWPEVVGLYKRAGPALTGRTKDAGDRSDAAAATLKHNAQPLKQYARALHRLNPEDAARREDGFQLAQWALQTDAGRALAQMSARFGRGQGPMVGLVRERQNLLARRQSDDRQLIAASARSDVAKVQALRASIAELDKSLDALDAELVRQFPDYADLTNPKPLAIADVQALLNADEAAILFMDLPDVLGLPGETLVWVITRESARWRSVLLDTAGLAGRVAALRCGLDHALWQDKASAEKCRSALGGAIPTPRGQGGTPLTALPFDLARAHELYGALFGPDADLIADKHLLIVPSGPLTGLPFGVLVTEQPESALPASLEGYAKAAWLGTRQPISILPSIGALKALRRIASTSHAAKAYLGIANPLLDGPSDDVHAEHYRKQAQIARERQQCPERSEERVALAGNGTGPARSLGDLLRGPHADIEQIRQATPLPETADEVCAVGERLSAGESDFLLAGHASEAGLKDLSGKGRLSDYRIVHFATHGAIAGEVDDTAEPGLILTPPAKGTSDLAALERDDGYLSASEIAALKLDADWVILSACNTASGADPQAEALSGLARAFFYAGARSLLVSHWEVESNATVKLVTGAFALLSQEAHLSRAEALQRSMLSLVSAEGNTAHPAYWAPFTVVGADPSIVATIAADAPADIIPPLPVRSQATARLAAASQATGATTAAEAPEAENAETPVPPLPLRKKTVLNIPQSVPGTPRARPVATRPARPATTRPASTRPARSTPQWEEQVSDR